MCAQSGGFRGVVAMLVALFLSFPAPSGSAQGIAGGLGSTMHAFLKRLQGMPGEFQPYLPRTGDLTYIHTTHSPEGDSVRVSRFTVEEVAVQLQSGGPIFEALYHSPEHQVVGLLVNQVECRGIKWRRVTITRFVPPGADASSPVFVEWRREGRTWVISSFGDESFAGDMRPNWGCERT